MSGGFCFVRISRTRTQAEVDAIIPELRAAIRDHIRYVRAIVAETLPEAFGTRSNVAD